MRNVTCKTTPVSRGKGHSAVAGAAYRAGENIKGIGQGKDGSDKWFRYAGRSTVVRETFIMAPDEAPDFVHDRATLWNHVEAMETSAKARLGREVQLGLAYELDHDQQRELVREFAQKEFVKHGFVVDVAIHNYGRTLPSMGLSEDQAQRLRDWAQAGVPFLSKDQAEGRSDPHVLEITNRTGDVTGYKLYQPHAHIRVTPRTVEEGGFADNKYASRELNRHETAMRWRYAWPELQNGYLERAGSKIRVTSTSAEEDEFPDLRFLGKRQNQEIQAIEERCTELSEPEQVAHAEATDVQNADDAFREMHNEVIKDTFTEIEDPAGSTSDEGETVRQARWWHNMSQRFHTWRFEFKDRAAEWQDRFQQQKTRIQRYLGWYRGPDEATGGGQQDPEPPEPQISPPEQEPTP